MTTRREEIAWAAGLFEGEGTVILRRNKNQAWTASIFSTDQDVLLRFHRVIEVGKLYGPYTRKNAAARPHHKPQWRWAVSDRDGFLKFAALVRPWLLSRRAARLDQAIGDMRKLTSGRWPEKGK